MDINVINSQFSRCATIKINVDSFTANSDVWEDSEKIEAAYNFLDCAADILHKPDKNDEVFETIRNQICDVLETIHNIKSELKK